MGNLGKVVITPKGVYNPLTQYNNLDLVTYNGSSFITKRPVKDVTPIEGDDYQLSAGGVDGDSLQEDINNIKSDIEDLSQSNTDLVTSINEINTNVGNKNSLSTIIKDNLVSAINEINKKFLVSVKDYGAKGDGIVDDTLSIQNAIDYAFSRGGGIVFIPNGVYMIKAHTDSPAYTDYLRDQGGIALKDNVTLLLDSGATLKAISNAANAYQVIRTVNRNNVKIIGGTIQGDRDTHTGTTGEWGYGIGVLGGSNITISDITCKDCWGDGVNIVNGISNTASDYPLNVLLSNIKCIRNMRNALTIGAGKYITVKDSEFKDSIGIQGEHGIDIEPWDAAIPVHHVTIENCICSGNNGCGAQIFEANTDDIVFNRCLFSNNKDAMYHEGQFKTIKYPTNITLNDCVFELGDAGCPIGVNVYNTYGFNINKCQFVNTTVVLNGYTKNVSLNDNIFTLTNYTETYIFLSPNEVNGLILNNNTYDVYNNVATAEEQFFVRGANVKITNNRFLGLKHGIGITSEKVRFTGNELHACDFEAAYITSRLGVISENIISGACIQNNGESCIRILDGSDYITVMNNKFYVESWLPVSFGGVAGSCINLSNNIAGGVIKNNIAIGGGVSIQFPIIRSNYTSNKNRVEMGATSNRSIYPQVGDSFYDTTLNKTVWYNGTNWKDAAGVTV